MSLRREIRSFVCAYAELIEPSLRLVWGARYASQKITPDQVRLQSAQWFLSSALFILVLSLQSRNRQLIRFTAGGAHVWSIKSFPKKPWTHVQNLGNYHLAPGRNLPTHCNMGSGSNR